MELMQVPDFFPFWKNLTRSQQDTLLGAAVRQTVKKGTVIHNGSMDCTGLFLICSGQLRAYILSEEGREVTIYRLFQRDICLFSASCIMRSIQFEVTIQAEKDSEMWLIPAETYKKVMRESADAANYTSELMAARFSDVMWLIEQIMWKSQDRRLAGFLVEEASIEDSDVIHITHEAIANHLGTAREVITRMLRYFQNENMVRLSRGTVEITDRKALQQLADS